MFLDHRGYPHCAWVDDLGLNYAFFGGLEWQVLDENSLITFGPTRKVPRHALCLDDRQRPHLALFDEDKTPWQVEWNGHSWVSNPAGGQIDSAPSFGVTVAFNGDLYAFSIQAGVSGMELVTKKATGGGWIAIGSPLLLSGYNNHSFDLLARSTGRWIHLFWKGSTKDYESSSSSEEGWIGHTVFNTISQTFDPIAPIAFSDDAGPIQDFWFHGRVDDPMSSSSSASSSSLSSSTSSSRSDSSTSSSTVARTSSSSSSRSSSSSPSSASSNSSSSPSSVSSSSSNSSSSSTFLMTSSSSSSSSIEDLNYLTSKNANLYGYWPFEISVGDDIVNGNTLTAFGSVSNATGVHGNAISLLNSSGMTSSTGSFIPGSNGIAVSLWSLTAVGNFTVTTANMQVNLSNLGGVSGTNYLQIYDIAGSQNVFPPSLLTPSVYPQNIVVICADSVVEVYFNGILIHSEVYSPAFTGAYDEMSVSTPSIGGVSCVPAVVDELAFWKEISFGSIGARAEFAKAIYNSGTGRFYDGSVWA